MFELTVQDVFRIKGRGVVATGRVASGAVSAGDAVAVNGSSFVVKGVERGRKLVESASAGDEIGLLLDDAAHDVLSRGAVLTGDGVARSSSSASGTSRSLEREMGLGEPRKKRRWLGG